MHKKKWAEKECWMNYRGQSILWLEQAGLQLFSIPWPELDFTNDQGFLLRAYKHSDPEASAFHCGSGLDLPFAVVVVLSRRTSLLMLRLHILAGHHLGKDCLSAVFLPLVWNVLWEAGTGVILETGLPRKGQTESCVLHKLLPKLS